MPTRRALLILAALSLACAEIEPLPDLGPGRQDALLGSSVDGMAPIRPPQEASVPREQGPPPDAGQPRDQAPAPCAPGDPLGLCSVCGDDGRPQAPERDETCPLVDCAEFATYQASVDAQGRSICEVILANPTGPNCIAQGRCADAANPRLCLPRMVGVTTAIAEGECRVILGCTGATPGEAGPAPEGTPCQGGAGVCAANGTCDTTLQEQCGDYAAHGQLCRRGVHAQRGAYCAVSQPAASAVNCSELCLAAQATCVGAERAEGCAAAGLAGCLDAPQGDHICWCRR